MAVVFNNKARVGGFNPLDEVPAEACERMIRLGYAEEMDDEALAKAQEKAAKAAEKAAKKGGDK